MRRNVITLMIALGIFAAIADSYSQQGRRRWASRRNYNPATVETVTGRIDTVISTPATKGRSARGIHLALTSTSGAWEAHLGPAGFLGGKISFARGDTVTIVGSRVSMGGKRVIIAKTVTKGTTVVTLRNDDGTPLWAGYNRRGR
ncbi:MAG: DNA-binding protein [Spirochaetes bacterium]|nr:DNA-binding protein [Spirochaetota bacterium]